MKLFKYIKVLNIRTKIEAVGLCLLMVSMAIAVLGHGTTIINASERIIDDAIGQSWVVNEADWIVTTDGSSYFGISGMNGQVYYQNDTRLGGADNVINACIGALPSGTGGMVLIKSGVFYINAPIELYRDYSGGWTPIYLKGSGVMNTKLSLVANSNCNMISFTISGTSSDGFKRISDLMLDGNKKYQSYGDGIFVDRTGSGKEYDFQVHDVFVSSCRYDGIYQDHGWGGRYNNVITEYNQGHGMYLMASSQMYIDNVFSAYNSESGFYFDGLNYVVSNINSRNNQWYGVNIKAYASCFSNVNVETWGHNTANAYYGIYLQSSANNNTFSNIYVMGDATNYCYNGIYCNGKDNTFSSLVVNKSHKYSVYLGSGSARNFIEINSKSRLGYYSDNGVCNVVNGLSYNAGKPGSAGNWASRPVPGVMVYDTSSSKLYMYVNEAWHQITIT
jgi:hypothetical protein